MAHVIPVTGTDRQRLVVQALGKIAANELHTTKDSKRLFLEGVCISPKYLGVVANTAARIALNVTHSKKCYPLDFCKQTDTGLFYVCVTNRGELDADWTPYTAQSPTRFEPVTNGDPVNTEIVFANGDIVMLEISN